MGATNDIALSSPVTSAARHKTNTTISGLFVIPGRVGGVENYFYNLLQGLLENGVASQYRLVLQKQYRGQFHPVVDAFNTCYINAPLGRVASDLSGQVRACDTHEHSTLFFPNFTAPLLGDKSRRIISTIHDVLYSDFPQHFPAWKRTALRGLHLHTLRRCDRVISISEFSRQALLETYGRQWQARITTIHNPVDFSRFYAPAEGADCTQFDKPFFLSVANQFAHKNLVTLVRAFNKLYPRAPRPCKLVLVGQTGARLQGSRNSGHQSQLLAEITKNPDIVVTGYIDDATLGALYRQAALFLFPSLYEGFGLPVVEAMGMGLATLTTRCGSIPEVSMNKCNYVEAPTEPDSWACSIESIVSSLGEHQHLAGGVARSIRDTYAPATIALRYADVLGGRARA